MCDNNNNNNNNNNQDKQLTLFSNIPLAKATTNRVLSEIENMLVAEIRYNIQQEIENNNNLNLDKPIQFSININKLGKEKSVKNPTVFKKKVIPVAEKLKLNIPSMTIDYVNDKNESLTYVMPFFTGMLINNTSGIVTIKANPDYQKYYSMNIKNYPELKINKQFYLTMKSKYSMPLSDWIIGTIAEKRKQGLNQKEYILEPSLEFLRNQIKSATDLNDKDYVKYVILSAVKDINTNPNSPFIITNDNEKDLKIKSGRKVIAISFHVSMQITPEDPVFISYPKQGVIDSTGTPSWEYIENILINKLRINESYMSKIKSNTRFYAWKILLYTLIHDGNAKYYNKIYESLKGEYDITYLAKQLKNTHPELVDEVIESIINLENNKNIDKETVTETDKDKKPESIKIDPSSPFYDIYKRHVLDKK